MGQSSKAHSSSSAEPQFQPLLAKSAVPKSKAFPGNVTTAPRAPQACLHRAASARHCLTPSGSQDPQSTGLRAQAQKSIGTPSSGGRRSPRLSRCPQRRRGVCGPMPSSLVDTLASAEFSGDEGQHRGAQGRAPPGTSVCLGASFATVFGTVFTPIFTAWPWPCPTSMNFRCWKEATRSDQPGGHSFTRAGEWAVSTFHWDGS